MLEKSKKEAKTKMCDASFEDVCENPFKYFEDVPVDVCRAMFQIMMYGCVQDEHLQYLPHYVQLPVAVLNPQTDLEKYVDCFSSDTTIADIRRVSCYGARVVTVSSNPDYQRGQILDTMQVDENSVVHEVKAPEKTVCAMGPEGLYNYLKMCNVKCDNMMFIHRIPVVLPVKELSNGQMLRDQFSSQYARLLRRSKRYESLSTMGAPNLILYNEFRKLDEIVRELFGTLVQQDVEVCSVNFRKLAEGVTNYEV